MRVRWRAPLHEQAEGLGLLGEPCRATRVWAPAMRDPSAAVVFTGRREDVPAVTAALDVAVLPSYREAQGLVILEAMALARPVVATDVGGIPEMIEDGVTGLLVPPHDRARWRLPSSRVLIDHPLADMLGRAGHRLVHERFCVERMVSAIETVYDQGWAAWRGRAGLVTEGPVTTAA